MTSVHRALDTRIFYKECVSVAAQGYETFLVANHNREEIVLGVKIIPVGLTTGNRLSRMTKTVMEVYKKAKEINADIYHFHDPELIPVGILLKLQGKKVVYDVHEDLPKDILDKKWLGPVFFRKVAATGARILESLADIFLDGVAAVSPSIQSKFRKSKSILLRNLPVVKIIDEIAPAKFPKENFTVIYAGGLTAIRGIRELIDAFSFLEGKASLWIFGSWESESYKNECMKSAGWMHVNDFGNKPQKEVFGYMKLADAGIVNFLPVENHLTAMPNKPFEYMACGLPVVMSDFPFWRETFEPCAVFVMPKDSQHISNGIKSLMENPQLAKKKSEAGRKYIETEYSWESEAKNLFSLYEKILMNSK